MKEKFKEFFNKLNNTYLVAAICALLIAVIVFGLMISLVAHPFATNTTYTAKIESELDGETYTARAKLVLMDEGRYSLTSKSALLDGRVTNFGDYGYGKIRLEEGKSRKNVIWFDGDLLNMVEVTSPFKLEYNEQTFTNVGGILLLVCYCFVIAIAVAIAVYLIIKRKDGKPAFTSKLRLVKRLKEIEEMLGVKHE